jgi:hypothetical protein
VVSETLNNEEAMISTSTQEIRKGVLASEPSSSVRYLIPCEPVIVLITLPISQDRDKRTSET